jgi:undecaprenyl-diphosphatase
VTLSQALALGILQGVAEFLPISSSGHLALAQNLMPNVGEPSLLFNVVVHLGTLVAIGFVLRARVWSLAQAGASLVTRRQGAALTEQRWVFLILLATLPTALIGFAGRGFVETMTLRPVWIGFAFLATALLLVFSQWVGGGERNGAALGVGDALLVGLFQGLGILPGISRSGSTIACALARRIRPDVAVEFSVLISIPAILGANLVAFADVESRALEPEIAPLAVGFAAASVTGVAALRALRWVVTRHRLLPFAAYCGLLGIGAIAVG